MAKCIFFFEKWHFAILVVSSPIFVADTKIITVYNFVAPLTKGYVRKEILTEDFQRVITTVFILFFL